MSLKLINALYKYYNYPQIDLLVNDDTYEIAKLLKNINFIHTFSYQQKRDKRWRQEKNIIFNIFRKYDLSINLTASDRSILYTLFASKNSISAIEKNKKKSWWKKILLTNYYHFDTNKHIFLNNLEPLNILRINHNLEQDPVPPSDLVIDKMKKRLSALNIEDFIIFHPSAQYEYKIYPKYLRDRLLRYLNSLDIPIIITGTNNIIDLGISNEIPNLKNIYNLISKTSLEEYLALSQLSLAYLGMDTLNMHIAATQNKRIFTIFGPTNLKMWSPWCNDLKSAANENKPMQTYGNITIFQAGLPCVACGRAGCDDDQGRSECIHIIDPKRVFFEVKKWCKSERL